ncbi:MAG: transcriptional regulator [Chloroflexota bacterium]|nr:MAG: transcriptional regulator [Chloroflexota bacterium]
MLQPQLIQNFEQMAKFIFVPTNEDEYNRLVELLDEITDIVRDDEEHPLANLMDVIGVLIETYENQHVPEPAGDPVAALKYFMEEHGLKQKDLPELGSQGIVSEILSRKRELNLRQIKALSERFKVPAAVFME